MLVRRARDDESDRIADVFIPSFEGLAFLPRLHTEDDTRDWIRTVVLAEQEVWVAEVEGRVVGYAALSDGARPESARADSGRAKPLKASASRPRRSALPAVPDSVLEHLYVHPDFQGRGAGTALLEHAKRERPAGFRFWVFQKNERARRFYERHGCRLVQLTDGAGNEEREPDALYEWVPTRVARTGSAPHGAAGPG
jgi:ribosomal protein S18 acetylase RimI-like enzyme